MMNGFWTRMRGAYFGYHQMRDLGSFGASNVKSFSYELKVEKYILSTFRSLETLELDLVTLSTVYTSHVYTFRFIYPVQKFVLLIQNGLLNILLTNDTNLVVASGPGNFLMSVPH
jgi:hypothetical protein